MKKVYIVTSGDYSEYRIEAVFTTNELAEDYVLHNGVDYEIEEYDVDEPFERGDVLWKVRMNIDTHEERGCGVTDKDEYKDLILYDDCTCSGDCLTFWIVADTSERAIKVANERLNQVKAGAMMFYREVFRRHRDRWGNTYKYVDYHTGQTTNPSERKERR
jgi:hypothetical protein